MIHCEKCDSPETEVTTCPECKQKTFVKCANCGYAACTDKYCAILAIRRKIRFFSYLAGFLFVVLLATTPFVIKAISKHREKTALRPKPAPAGKPAAGEQAPGRRTPGSSRTVAMAKPGGGGTAVPSPGSGNTAAPRVHPASTVPPSSRATSPSASEPRKQAAAPGGAGTAGQPAGSRETPKNAGGSGAKKANATSSAQGEEKKQASPPILSKSEFARRIQQVMDSLRHIPYKKHGKSPDEGLDYVGFVRWVFLSIGWEGMPSTIKEMSYFGKKIKDINALEPGDILFFSRKKHGTHARFVGIYYGEGKFVCMHPKKKWVKVKVTHRFFKSRFLFACRYYPKPNFAER